MTGTELIEMEEDNVIDIKTRQATGGPTKPENWLESLAIATVFACRPKDLAPYNGKMMPQWLLQELQIIMKHNKCTELAAYQKEPFLVDTKRFCEEHELVEVIHNPVETDP